MSFLTKDMYRIRPVDDSPSGVPGWQVARVRACMQLSPMRHTTLVLCSGMVLGVIVAPALSAQATGGAAPGQSPAFHHAHHAALDQLLGHPAVTPRKPHDGPTHQLFVADRLHAA